MNCHNTNNPCGLDNWPVGRPCPCPGCQQWLRDVMSSILEGVVDGVIAEGNPTSPTEVQAVLLKVAIAAFQLGYLKGNENNNPSGTNTPSPDALY